MYQQLIFDTETSGFVIDNLPFEEPTNGRIIQIAAQAAGQLIKPIGVCGEAAANPYLAAVLLGLGVNSLSMAPSAISEVRGFLATVDLQTCQAAAQRAVSASSATQAEQWAKEILDK